MKKPMDLTDTIRRPVVAGSFYTAHAPSLSDEIVSYLKSVPDRSLERLPIGLIVPHAGYMYSGQIAAYGYKHIVGLRYDTVIVCAPSHRAYFPGASVDRKSAYRTPLGDIPIDSALAESLMTSCDLISFYEQAHAEEHAVEVQLPFLQTALQDLSIVPFIMGSQDLETCEALAQALAKCIQGRNVLTVASSDLSHYHPHGQATVLDQHVIDHITAYDPQGLALGLKRRHMEACGGGPIITTLFLGKHLGATRAEIVKYATSGDVSGDYSGVVGYAAGVIY
ncbi:MAG TPA: AmmeMemoRadiSam system protein B [Thermodesulfobacteriota bacterium]|nr:AmmeMemoRadiSam system protein B [Deltaproteobacteria bacterium]HNR12852.1 AmmeMemoRadiSam system protein B [Thermodesulfobacteriota bacterium]HNU72989.1 AmmeMemoRadiSam system protein B [Thermodesulfobacteriota bacterium]HOC39152.1 AmmeMemoRadiSam system protein B [Thermodesulfobacteriota bacterium]HQO77604.1 AmmeMemoRadiSam system protein B [Thermodesulfobacteriota bacterium]